MIQTTVISFSIGILLLSLLGIVANVFLAVCVYNDAKYRGSENAVLWAVLSGFFNIVALIYIIIACCQKKPQTLWCKQCGGYLNPESVYCPHCGRYLDKLAPEENEKYNKRRKLFLILWIISIVTLIVITVIFVVSFIAVIAQLADSGSLNNYRF